jgi:hypothetical protein
MPALEALWFRVRLWTEVALWRRGRLWAVSTVVILVAISLHLTATYWTRQERQQWLQAQAAQATARTKPATRTNVPPRVTTSTGSNQDRLNIDVQPLLSTLADRRQLGSQVHQLFALAGRQGVGLPQSNFQTEETKGSMGSRWTRTRGWRTSGRGTTIRCWGGSCRLIRWITPRRIFTRSIGIHMGTIIRSSTRIRMGGNLLDSHFRRPLLHCLRKRPHRSSVPIPNKISQ